jgi:succinate dehydrogenase / fumarate reductase iron-sulfur subunit
VRVLRQDQPRQPGYWQEFKVPYEPDMNTISVLMKIAEQGATADGQRTAPVAWECNCLEEVCGSCTMVINGRVRQACTALVDQLLKDQPEGIELRPMSKFPVVRDLMVDRGRMFAGLEKVKAWVPVDGYYDVGPGPGQSQKQQEMAYEYSKCMTCGCCLEACPQYEKIELAAQPGETPEAFKARQREAYNSHFMGPYAIAQVDLFNMNPIAKLTADERLEALVSEGGIQMCGNAQNCVKVCPKGIPLTSAIGRQGRAATIYSLKKLFDR